MQSGKRSAFATIRAEGGLLPADLLVRIASGDTGIDHLSPEAYHLARSERINEATNRSWNRLCGAWEGLKAGIAKLPDSDVGTTLTRERWLLILFQELGYGRLQRAKALDIEGKAYPVSHSWQATPIHLVSFRQELDRSTPGARGASRISPHSLVQELLSRSDEFLWGFVSNGLRLRLLRDNASFTRAAFVEFDLEAMMEGELYSDFFLLYLICHQSRVEVPEGKTAEHCILESWRNNSLQEGTRVLDSLRGGVEKAIEALGGGFLSHPANRALRERLRSGVLPTQDYYREVLRIVYRILFIFVAEDRDLLLLPSGCDPVLAEARDIYDRYYSTQRLRRLAERRRSARHGDLYVTLKLVFSLLESGCSELALPALGSYLFSPKATPDLNDASIANSDLLDAVRYLAFTIEGNVRRTVDYRNLGPEELGSVYESLLEMSPEVNLDAALFKLNVATGSERKTTGSYYTHSNLVNCLLDSALNPVLDRACGESEPEKALLGLKICDPACGSGHFLIAAAHRIGKRLATVRAGEEEPAPEAIQHAVRDTVGHCLYGVDINPMAAELCRVSLWLEALEPGKPLSFLDHHIRVGNSLLGATPQLIAAGLPDEAYEPIEGDDKKACVVLKKLNRAERYGMGPIFAQQDAETQNRLQQSARALEELPDDNAEEISAKEQAFRHQEQADEYHNKKQLADAWCTAFIIKKRFRELGRESSASGITNGHLIDLASDRPLPADLAAEVDRLSAQHQFFHWHLAFPDVFVRGGFDCVLGNPPWERTAFEEVPYFSSLVPEIAAAPTTAIRRELIAQLEITAPDIYQKFYDDRRKIAAEDAFFSTSAHYPLSSSGRTNTFALFADLASGLTKPSGYVGLVIPTAIATDAPMQEFWGSLVRDKRVVSLYDFENRGIWFPSVHGSYKFALLTMTGSSGHAGAARYAFFLDTIEDLQAPARVFHMTPDELSCVNPYTRQPPTCRSRADFELLLHISRQEEPLGESHPAWVGLTSAGSSDSWMEASEYEPAKHGEYVPCYESKLMHQFDHRFASFSGAFGPRQSAAPDPAGSLRGDPEFRVQTRFLVPYRVARTHLERKTTYLTSIPCYRDLSDNRALRTMIATIVPFCGLLQPLNGITAADAHWAAILIGSLNSFAADYITRLKTPGMHVNVTIFNQLPKVPIAKYSHASRVFLGSPETWLENRILELTYTAWDLQPFAKDCGWPGPPFHWDEERRFLLRCELDAAFFHIYLPTDENGGWHPAECETAEELARLKASFSVPRDAVAYVMDTFPIVQRKDEENYGGDYRTKRVILEIYDAIQESIRTGQPYQTRLDPPPADPRCCHPAREARQS